MCVCMRTWLWVAMVEVWAGTAVAATPATRVPCCPHRETGVDRRYCLAFGGWSGPVPIAGDRLVGRAQGAVLATDLTSAAAYSASIGPNRQRLATSSVCATRASHSTAWPWWAPRHAGHCRADRTLQGVCRELACRGSIRGEGLLLCPMRRRRAGRDRSARCGPDPEMICGLKRELQRSASMLVRWPTADAASWSGTDRSETRVAERPSDTDHAASTYIAARSSWGGT